MLTAMHIRLTLLDATKGESSPIGNRLGKKVFHFLDAIVQVQPKCTLFEISLEGIRSSDASFPRDSVLMLAKVHRGTYGFYLTGDSALGDPDLVLNWSAAASILEQPLFLWRKGMPTRIGPEPTQAAQEMIRAVVDKRVATAAQVADRLNISIHNSSTRLKRLSSEGYILRREAGSPSGGVEFEYLAMGPEASR